MGRLELFKEQVNTLQRNQRDSDDILIQHMEKNEIYDGKFRLAEASMADYDEILRKTEKLLNNQGKALDQKLFPAAQDYDQWFNYVKQDVRSLFRLREAIAVAHPKWFEGLEIKQNPRTGNPPKL